MFEALRKPALLFWTALQLSACSALIDVSGQQCQTDAQCRDKQLGVMCVDHVCVDAPEQATASIQDGTPQNQHCVKESECSGSTPRCMRGTCVSEDVAELFLCRKPEAPPVDAGPVKYSFKVIEYVSRKPPKNITARACRANDVDCVDAIAPLQIAPDTGLIDFSLPRGFMGFFEVHSDALPALSYLTKPIVVDTVDHDLQLSSRETLMSLAMADGADVDESKGVAVLEAFDCTGTPVGGVHFDSNSSGVRPFYIVDHVPNHNVTVSSFDPANNIAAGGFLNIEPGFVTFTARYGVGGPVLGMFNAAVRANTYTFVDMYF